MLAVWCSVRVPLKVLTYVEAAQPGRIRARETPTRATRCARVEKASMGALRAALDPVWHAEKAEDIEPAPAARMRPLGRRLFDLCARHGVTFASLHDTIGTVPSRVETALGLRDA
jgi:hypothetical protein